MRAIHHGLSGALFVALMSHVQLGFAQTASATPAAATSTAPVACASGETMQHGHCCAVGADWVQAQHVCMAHNRREVMVIVDVTNSHGALPSDLAVTIDGTPMTGTPPVGHITPGHHVVEVTGTGMRTAHEEMTLTAGQVQRVAVALESSVGRIVVNVSTANAQITLDGNPLSGSPATGENLPPGVHHVQVVAAEHDTVSRDVTVAAGETATVDVGDLAMTVVASASPTPAATVTVVTAPTQVLVIQSGTMDQTFDVDVTANGRAFHCISPVDRDRPCTLHDVPVGSATITASGTSTFTSNVAVLAGTTTAVIHFTPSMGKRVGYLVAGIASFVPAIVFWIVTAAAGPTNRDTLVYASIGLTVVPGLLPGAVFIASGVRPQGSGEINTTSDTTPVVAPQAMRRVPYVQMASAPEVSAPRAAGAMFTF